MLNVSLKWIKCQTASAGNILADRAANDCAHALHLNQIHRTIVNKTKIGKLDINPLYYKETPINMDFMKNLMNCV
jgi:hypothetical protein